MSLICNKECILTVTICNIIKFVVVIVIIIIIIVFVVVVAVVIVIINSKPLKI